MFRNITPSSRAFSNARAPVRVPRARVESDPTILEGALDLSTDPSTGDFLVIFA